MSPTPSSAAPAAIGRAWAADLLAGFLVFLIALPLCLGISMASGFPPLAGVITAIVGGVLASFAGSAPLTIKGPAAGLIVIALGAVTELGGGDLAAGYPKALAVGVVAAIVQIAFALLRSGKLGEMFPASVVHGMLAAIGVIIVSKQAHILLGVKPAGKEPLHLLAEIPHSIAQLNPAIAAIGLVSFLVLVLWPRVPVAAARKVPAPLVVLLVAVPMGIAFGLDTAHSLSFGPLHAEVGPKDLVRLGGTLWGAITLPDFSEILSSTSLKYIVMFSLVGSIESLLSAKAVDILDPWKRKSDLDKDLLAVGVGNLVASMLGGLPMISEIVRSSANINNGARTRLANFFHGLFLLAFVAAVPALIERIPLAALAAMLVFTGLRLASPAEFKKTLQIGNEQLLIFTATLVVTLATDLLLGVGAGILLKWAIHLKNGASLRSLFRPAVRLDLDGTTARIAVEDAAVFSNYLGLRGKVQAAEAAGATHIEVDFTRASLVDHTVMERMEDLTHELAHEGRTMVLRGLDQHEAFSAHPLAGRRRKAA